MTYRTKVAFQEKYKFPEGSKERLQEICERRVEEFKTLREKTDSLREIPDEIMAQVKSDFNQARDDYRKFLEDPITATFIKEAYNPAFDIKDIESIAEHFKKRFIYEYVNERSQVLTEEISDLQKKLGIVPK